MNLKQDLKFASLVILILAVALVFRLSELNEIASQETLLAHVNALGPKAPIFFVVFAILATFAFIPRTLFTVVGAYAFGFHKGVLLTYIGILISAGLMFTVGRYLGKKTIRQWIPEKYEDHLDHISSEKGIRLAIIMRIIPIFPFQIVNYSLAFSKISFPRYIIGSAIGLIPDIVIYSYFVDSLAGDEDNISKNLIALAIFFGFILISYLIKRHHHKKLEKFE